MSDPASVLQFEVLLSHSLVIPEPDPGFAQTLRSRLSAQAAVPAARRSKARRMVWALVLGLVLLIALTVWIIGPQRVAAEVQKLFEYIPGFGIVEQNAPLRALEKPVSQTRDGITLTITQAFLSPAKTVVTYTLEGVPWSAYSHNEAVPGCIPGAALRLPDGTLLPLIGGGGPPTQVTVDFPPIPAKVDSFTFVLPCIQDTLPGLAPENWELPLRVVPAAALTAMPVFEVSPSPQPQQNTPLPPKNPLVLLQVIDTGNSYVLLGEFRQADASDASVPSGSWWSAGLEKITDASGQAVFNTVPYDPTLLLPPSEPGAEPWSYQIGKTFTPPLTITYRGQDIYPAVPNATAAIDFDAGPSPQPGQEWVLNQDFVLAGHAIRLTSIQAVGNTGGLRNTGYEFSFESSDPSIYDLSVAISGYTVVGGGGGYGGTPSGQWQTELDYTVQPKGKLEVVLSGLTLYGETRTWQLQWSPATAEPGSPSLYGISMGIDRILSTAAGTYLLGHTSWTDSRIVAATTVAGSFTATDSQGQAVPLEPANGQDVGLTLGPNQWLYRIAGNSFAAPLTLRATQMQVTFKQPVQLTLDLRPYGFDGSDAQLGLNPLEVPGLIAVPHWITYIRSGDLRGFDILMEADPALLALPFSIASGTNSQGTPVFQSGGASTRDPASGQLLSTVLTKGNITLPMVLSASGETVSGSWVTIWASPAASPTASPTQATQP